MKEPENDRTYYLSKEVSDCLKGFFAVCVFLHHIYQRTGFIKQPALAKLFEVLGYLSVSVFLFFSGYGLMVSYIKKGHKYMKTFVKKRILPLFCVYLFLVILYSVERILLNINTSYKDVIESFWIFKSVVIYGWYIQSILFFYIIFYLCFTYSKNIKTGFYLMLISVLMYMVLFHVTSQTGARYLSMLSLALGLLWGKHTKVFDRYIEGNKKAVIISLVMFVLLLWAYCAPIEYFQKLCARMFSSPAFVVLVLSLTAIICARKKELILNRVLYLLGSISLEIYVSQGLFFRLFHSKILYIENNFIYIVTVWICTVVFSFLLHYLFSYIYILFGKNQYREGVV